MTTDKQGRKFFVKMEICDIYEKSTVAQTGIVNFGTGTKIRFFFFFHTRHTQVVKHNHYLFFELKFFSYGVKPICHILFVDFMVLMTI